MLSTGRDPFFSYVGAALGRPLGPRLYSGRLPRRAVLGFLPVTGTGGRSFSSDITGWLQMGFSPGRNEFALGRLLVSSY
jgi:hypothetical protein